MMPLKEKQTDRKIAPIMFQQKHKKHNDGVFIVALYYANAGEKKH